MNNSGLANLIGVPVHRIGPDWINPNDTYQIENSLYVGDNSYIELKAGNDWRKRIDVRAELVLEDLNDTYHRYLRALELPTTTGTRN